MGFPIGSIGSMAFPPTLVNQGTFTFSFERIASARRAPSTWLWVKSLPFTAVVIPLFQWIGVRENLNRTPWFLPSNIGGSSKFFPSSNSMIILFCLNTGVVFKQSSLKIPSVAIPMKTYQDPMFSIKNTKTHQKCHKN